MSRILPAKGSEKRIRDEQLRRHLIEIIEKRGLLERDNLSEGLEDVHKEKISDWGESQSSKGGDKHEDMIVLQVFLS